MTSHKKQQQADISSKFKKSILKWPGGKSKVLGQIFDAIPEYKKNEYSRFVDVFAGSGVVVANASFAKTKLAADINGDLTTLFSTLSNQYDQLELELESLFSGAYNNQESYTKLRDEFNTAECVGVRRAAVFVYLNKHAFNGVCRYNSKGKFNVPYGRPTANPTLDKKSIKAFAETFNNTEIKNLSFEKILPLCGAGDIVYCDPPYSPLSHQKSNFTSYAGNIFGPNEHALLAKLAHEAALRGAIVLISNHDTEETRELYKAASAFSSFDVRRSINSNGQGRNKVAELIAVFGL